MPKVSKIKNHLTEEEIQEKIKGTVGFWRVQRWMIIYQAKVAPATADELAKRFGVAVSTIHYIISTYNRKGACGIETPGKGQRQRAYLSYDNEKSFLKPFIEKADKGELTTINQIKAGYDKLVGKQVNRSTIYRLLKRHGWRKVVPRSYHPKSSKEEQETFKKTFRPK